MVGFRGSANILATIHWKASRAKGIARNPGNLREFAPENPDFRPCAKGREKLTPPKSDPGLKYVLKPVLEMYFET